ncbi:hypothetical protein HK096_004714, partial [Nowakowskiella sp. JEL0078]
MSRKVPDRFDTQPSLALKWAKQYLKEQKCLLELLSQLFYNKIECPPKRAAQIIKIFVSNIFGLAQPNQALYDIEAQNMLKNVSQMCLLLAIEVMSLEVLINDRVGEHLIYPPPENSLLSLNPDCILEITGTLCNMNDKYKGQIIEAHGPLLVSWASFLEQVRVQIDSAPAPIPDAFKRVSLIIHRGTGSMMIQPIPANANELLTTQFLTRAQNLNFWSHLTASFSLPCFDPVQSSLSTYFSSIYKGLLTLFQKSFNINRLQKLDSLTTALAKIFTNQADLATQFWEQDFVTPNAHAALDVATHRFPLVFPNLLTLLTSLTQTPDCARCVVEYLAAVAGATIIARPGDCTRPVGGELGMFEWTGTRGLVVGATAEMNLWVPRATRAFVVGEEERIVRLEFGYSAWWLFCAMLDSFVRGDEAVVVATAVDAEIVGNVENVTLVLMLVNNVLRRADEELFKAFIAHLDGFTGFRAAVAATGLATDFVSLCCRVLTRCGVFATPPFALLKQILDFLALVSDFAPVVVWTQLNQNPLVPSGRNVNEKWIMRTVVPAERSKGTYEVLTAFLELTLLLVRNITKLKVADATSHESNTDHNHHHHQINISVVASCISFMHTDVFPAYNAWRYQSIAAKHRIGELCLDIYNVLLRDTAATSRDLAPLQSHVREAFRGRAGGVYYVAPLIRCVAIDMRDLEALYRRGLHALAKRIESVLILGLALMQQLVGVGDVVSVLEASLLDCVAMTTNAEVRPKINSRNGSGVDVGQEGEENSEFVFRIAVLAAYPYNPEVPVAAMRALKSLVKVAALWTPRPPSFVGYFGERAKDVVKSFVELVMDKTVGEPLRTAVWRFFTETVESQPGFVGLVVAELQELSQVLEDCVGDNDSAGRQCEEAILRFATALWKREPMFRKAMSGLRNQKFWHQIARVVKEHIEIANTNNEVFCYAMCSKAHALRIVALDIFYRKPDNNINNIPADVFDIVKNLIAQTPRGTSAIRELGSVNIAMDETTVKKLDNIASQVIGENSLRRFKVVRVDGELNYGEMYVFDAELLEMKGADIAHVDDKFGLLLTMMRDINKSWSVVDANMVLVKSWTFLVQILHTLFGAALWESANATILRGSSTNDNDELFKIILMIAENTAAEKGANIVGALYRTTMGNSLLSCVNAWVELHSARSSRGRVVEPKVYENALSLVMVLLNGLEKVRFLGDTMVLMNEESKIDEKTLAETTANTSILTSLLLVLRMLQTLFEELENVSSSSISSKQKSPYESVLRSVGENFPAIVHSVCVALQAALVKAIATTMLPHVDTVDRDLQLLMTVLNELIRLSTIADLKTRGQLRLLVVSSYLNAQIWIPTLETTQIIPMLLKLFAKQVSLASEWFEKHERGGNGDQFAGVNPGVENSGVMHLLLVLAGLPQSAEKLAVHGLLNVFSNNELSPALAEGKIEVYIGQHVDAVKSSGTSGERSVWHRVWCLCLAIISECLSHHHTGPKQILNGSQAKNGTGEPLSNNHMSLSYSRQFLAGVAGFIGVTAPQIVSALQRYSNVDKSSQNFSNTINIGGLEEVERITEIVYEISFAEFSPNRNNKGNLTMSKIHQWSASLGSEAISTSNEFPKHLGRLLSVFVYLFTHPGLMSKLIIPVTRDERESPILVTACKSMERAVRNIINYLALVTDAQYIISHQYSPADWAFENLILSPTLDWELKDMLNNEEPEMSIPVLTVGSLMDTFQHIMNLLDTEIAKIVKRGTVNSVTIGISKVPNDESGGQFNRESVGKCKMYLEIAEALLLLVTTQMALYMSSPHIEVNKKDTAKNEVANDVLGCIQQAQQKLSSLLGRSGSLTPRMGTSSMPGTPKRTSTQSPNLVVNLESEWN